jgi:hypothetical protein
VGLYEAGSVVKYSLLALPDITQKLVVGHEIPDEYDVVDALAVHVGLDAVGLVVEYSLPPLADIMQKLVVGHEIPDE